MKVYKDINKSGVARFGCSTNTADTSDVYGTHLLGAYGIFLLGGIIEKQVKRNITIKIKCSTNTKKQKKS